jgi:hypothetical protein
LIDNERALEKPSNPRRRFNPHFSNPASRLAWIGLCCAPGMIGGG